MKYHLLLAWPLLILLCLVWQSGCGLEKYTIVLNAPVGDINAGVEYFRFDKTTTTDVEPEFRGFELYYRFYNFGSPLEAVDTYEDLAAKRYRRVNANPGAETRLPLIRVDLDDRGKAFWVRVDFSNIQAPDYPQTYNEQPPDLDPNILIKDFRRAVPRPFPDEDEFKSFSDFAATDDDIKDLSWDAFQIRADLDLYVLSYGYYVPLNKSLYSEPVWLGTITRDFVVP